MADASAVNIARGKEAAAEFHEAENVAAAQALAAKINGKVRLHVGVVASFKIQVEVEQA